MKFHIKPIIASALALSAASAFSAPNTAMKVEGKIITAGCNLSFPQGEVSDFGDLTDADFEVIRPSVHRTLINSKQLSVMVACPADTSIAIKVSDNNAGSKPNEAVRFFHFDTVGAGREGLVGFYQFGIGLASNNVPIGAYAIRIGDISVDGVQQPVVLFDRGNGDAWQDHRGFRFLDLSIPYIAPGNSENKIVMGKTFTFPFDIALNVTTKDDLPVNEAIVIDASSTVEVKYL